MRLYGQTLQILQDIEMQADFFDGSLNQAGIMMTDERPWAEGEGERDGSMTEQGKRKNPLVSVIIPTYNRVHTLPVSVDSVLRQTYKNLEVIIVDDGSTDGTENFVRELSDNRVRYVRNIGKRGPAAARNYGVTQARGEFVAFQDSDDEWHPEKLEKQMPLLLNTEEKIDLVYCEYTWYYGQTRRDTVPPRTLPIPYKQGHILPVLLLQPLISTPTIVVKKKCFVQERGFNENLATFEDYEFSVRFSQNHIIGFVEESLVKENDSPDSVDKRFADRIRTQAYIIREMIAPLREYDLLSQKLSEVQKTAEHLKCHDVFLEELRGMGDLLLTEKEREIAVRLAEKTMRSDAKQNQRKEIAKDALMHAKLQLVEAYKGVFRDTLMTDAALEQVLRQVRGCIEECTECFEIPDEFQDRYILGDGLVSDCGAKLDCLTMLADVVKTVEELERYIYGQQVECNVCNCRFYKNHSRRCPYCEADDRERLLIAFLKELQPEEGEILRVLHMTSSKLIDNYLLKRKDILLEYLNPGTDYLQAMRDFEEDRYDILIASELALQTYTVDMMMTEWGKIMKTGGACLVFPASGRGKQVDMNLLTTSRLCVNELGEEWFGADFYSTCGIDGRMVLTMLTKGDPLAENVIQSPD